MTISLLHPSRGRSKKALSTFTKWKNNASGLHKIEHILSLDYTDNELHNYKLLSYSDWTQIIIRDNKNCVQATNNAASACHGDILVMLSDDFDCPKGWDNCIINAFAEMGDRHGYVLKTFDGLQKWIVTLAIMDRAYFEMNGYFYNPIYQHMFCDTALTHKAELQGRLIFRNDLVFKHNHYSQGHGKEDETHRRANATWNHGEAAYLNEVRNWFGIEGMTVEKALQLNPLAHQSVAWLKNKLRVK